MELRDRRVVEVAREREVDRVVGGRGPDLPALGVQEPLAGGVPVDLEREVDPVEQALQRARLGLGIGGRAAVRVARGDRGRALLVVLEVGRVVAVGVDAVADLGHAVAVVVAQVLAPQALGVERVLVAVRVRHEHEPQLGVLQQRAHLLVAGVPAADVGAHQAPVDLGRDPLARVLRGAVEHRGALAVTHVAGVVGHLEPEDLAALQRPAERDELRDVAVVARDLVQLVADPAVLVPRAPDVEAVGGLLGGELLHRQPALHARQRGVDAVLGQPVALTLRHDEVHLDAAGPPSARGTRSPGPRASSDHRPGPPRCRR